MSDGLASGGPVSGGPRRVAALGTAAALAAAGILLRLGPPVIGWRLPLALHHSGGGFLWGGMDCALVAVLHPPGWRWRTCLCAALAIIAAVESLRLIHGPPLDSFRITIAGQWLLGHVFSPVNIVVDGLGAATMAALSAYRDRHRQGTPDMVRTSIQSRNARVRLRGFK